MLRDHARGVCCVECRRDVMLCATHDRPASEVIIWTANLAQVLLEGEVNSKRNIVFYPLPAPNAESTEHQIKYKQNKR
eukprot:14097829-Heterocapsa_arctica.AAC.1